MNETGHFEELRRAQETRRRWHWVLIGLGLVLSVVLLLNGAVVIGVIVGVMAVVRAAMVLQWQRQAAGRRPR